jgi:hypothetical protein
MSDFVFDMSDFEGSATNDVGKADDNQLTAEELRGRADAALGDPEYLDRLRENTK